VDPGNVEFARAKVYGTKGFRAAERGVNRHSNLRRALAASVTDNRSGSSTVCFTNGPGCLIHSVYLEKRCFQD
jgi:hypothetical protein